MDGKHNHYDLVLSLLMNAALSTTVYCIVLMSRLKTPIEHQQLHQDTDLSHAAQRWCSAGAEMSNMQLVAGEEVGGIQAISS